MTLSSTCPACNAPRSPNEGICAVCGLVFATHTQGGAPAAGRGVTAPLPPMMPRPAGSAPLHPGQRLAGGRYTVLRLISRGGMGAVALASDADAFGRTVVVKAMLDYYDPARPQDAQEARERFVEEARTLAELRHPAIPQIYAYFQDGAQNYIVMEYVEGHDLEQGLTQRGPSGVEQRGRPYPQDQVLCWGVSVCRVLEYLAGRRPDPVVHHDIKPANLLLDGNSGEVRLVDFGTARRRPQVGTGRPVEPGFGTPGYAPPEQYRGEGEPRSDVYALAATLYHLATDDDPRDHPFSFPLLDTLGELGPLLRRALDRQPGRRPGAAELRGGLETLLRPSGPPPIEAPDGTPLPDRVALGAWCERHWSAAAGWVAGNLPHQIELRWGQTRLAHQLLDAARQHFNDENASLDTALALLDPQGFGREAVRLTHDPPVLHFGVMSRNMHAQRTLILRNTGRRYAAINLRLPPWIAAPKSTLWLRPGERITVELSARPTRSLGPHPQDRIQLMHGGRQIGQIPVAADLPLGVRLATALGQAGTSAKTWKTLATVTGTAAVLYSLFDMGGWGSAPPELAPSSWGTAVAVVDPGRGDQPPSVRLAPSPVPPDAVPTPPLSDQLASLGTPTARGLSVNFADRRYVRIEGDVVNLYQLGDAGPLLQVAKHNGLVRDAAYSPDGRTIATIGDDRALRLWNTGDGSFEIIELEHLPLRLSWRPDSEAIAVADVEGVRVLSIRERHELGVARGVRGVIDMHWFREDGQILSIVDDRMRVQVWSPSLGRDPMLILKSTGWFPPAFSGDGRRAALVVGQEWRIYRIDDIELLFSIPYPKQLHAFALSSNGRLLAVLHGNELEIWDLSQGLSVLRQPAGDAVRVQFGPDDRELALIGADSTVTVVSTSVP
ncbi:MAG TPA: protein kinase [Roseiflexaceae bacterium]|nr:protein kinase [Roseiflexaceae bacterium]